MANFVNQEAFFKWYGTVSKTKKYNKDKLLNDVFQQYCTTRVGRYELPPESTVSGKQEHYDFKFEDIGKCGGSAIFIYF